MNSLAATSTVTCITFHRVRLPAPVDADARGFAGPATAAHWLCAPA